MSVRLKLVFAGSSDKKINLSFPYAKQSADPALVKTLAQMIVANGDIYAESPLAPISAEFVTSTTTPIDIS